MLNRIIERLRALFSRQAKTALDIAEDAIEDAVEDLNDLANKTKAELVEMARDLDLAVMHD
jgi:predicted DNA-binding protein